MRCVAEILEKCVHFVVQLRRQINLSSRKGRRTLNSVDGKGYCQMDGFGKGLPAETFALLGSNLAFIGKFLPTFRDITIRPFLKGHAISHKPTKYKTTDFTVLPCILIH